MPASWLSKCTSWQFLLKKLLSLLFQKPTILPAALSSMLPKDLRSLAKITACPWLLLNLLRGTGHQDSVVSWKHCDNCICYAGTLLANLLHVRLCLSCTEPVAGHRKKPGVHVVWQHAHCSELELSALELELHSKLSLTCQPGRGC